MKNPKLFFSIVLCYSGLSIRAAEPQAATLERVLSQSPIYEALLPYLCTPDIVHLGDVSQGIRKTMEPAILKAAIRESYLLNARHLNLDRQRMYSRDNQAFKTYVIKRIETFATKHPETWLKLNLSHNNLGKDLDFLRDLLHAIVTTLNSLKINLISLNLSENQLKTLPEHLFEGLNNLQKLNLGGNKFESWPVQPFEGLHNLQKIVLSHNGLTMLPESLFKDLTNLQEVVLSHNGLTTLPEGLFERLHNLLKLDLSTNQFKILPECIFGGLSRLREIHLFNNQLVSLPEHLFKGSNNVQALSLSNNQLIHLPKHLFEGLHNLKMLYLGCNNFDEETIAFLQAFFPNNTVDFG